MFFLNKTFKLHSYFTDRLLLVNPHSAELINPRPHLGGGGVLPQGVFLAAPHTVWDKELILCKAAFLTFIQISWNL